MCRERPLQTHHVHFRLKRRGNGRFHFISTWNTRDVFVGTHGSPNSFSEVDKEKILKKILNLETPKRYQHTDFPTKILKENADV